MLPGILLSEGIDLAAAAAVPTWRVRQRSRARRREVQRTLPSRYSLPERERVSNAVRFRHIQRRFWFRCLCALPFRRFR